MTVGKNGGARHMNVALTYGRGGGETTMPPQESPNWLLEFISYVLIILLKLGVAKKGKAEEEGGGRKDR